MHALPEYAVRCGEIKGTAVSFFNISYIHLNECDANSYTIILEEKEKILMFFYYLIQTTKQFILQTDHHL